MQLTHQGGADPCESVDGKTFLYTGRKPSEGNRLMLIENFR